MTRFLERDRLAAERASIEGLLRETSAEDFLGRYSLQQRIDWIDAQLKEIGDESPSHAKLALAFVGDPVIGDRAIDADFSSKILHAFQSAVSTTYASQVSEGFVGERGPTAGARDAALHITGVVHGSFGFVLEELDPRGDQWTETSLNRATKATVSYVEALASQSSDQAEEVLDHISFRLLQDLEGFFAAMHASRAGVRISSHDHESRLDASAVERAYIRVKDTRVEEREDTREGALFILPDSRRFEFQTEQELLKGTAAVPVVEEYVRSLSGDSLAGRTIKAVFKVKVFRRPSAPPRTVYRLISVNPLA